VQCIATPWKSSIIRDNIGQDAGSPPAHHKCDPLVHMPTHLRSVNLAHATEMEGISCKIVYQMSTNLDRFLPFSERRHHPFDVSDRWEVPLTLKILHTFSGFFSALVFHAVTFSTPCLFSHTPLLQSLDVWEESMSRIKNMVAEASNDRQYFCDPMVYGTPQDVRWRCSISLVGS